MVLKSEVALHQSAADGLTQAGLGTYGFAIAERQVVPATGQPVGEDSPFVVVTYTGQQNRDKLWGVVNNAKAAQLIAEREGKPQEAIDQVVQDAIKTGIEVELRRQAHFNAMMDAIQRRSGR